MMSERKNPTGAASITTRRTLIAGAAIAFGGLAAGSKLWANGQQKTTEPQSTGTEGLLTYLHQEIAIQAVPHRVYEALLDSKRFAAFTGMPAQISRDAGGVFSTFGGLIEGRNVELVPDKRIVQAWRPGDWEPGVYSLVKFELGEKGSATVLILDHTGFPEGSFRHLDSGWYLRYWEPLKKFLA
jgi:activator of HSP90 ATPase